MLISAVISILEDFGSLLPARPVAVNLCKPPISLIFKKMAVPRISNERFLVRLKLELNGLKKNKR